MKRKRENMSEEINQYKFLLYIYYYNMNNNIKKINPYTILYISDNDSDNDSLDVKQLQTKEKIYHLCNNFKKMKICRKSYKNKIDINHINNINKNIIELEKDINKLCINIRTNDKLLIPNKKQRNFGCCIYE